MKTSKTLMDATDSPQVYKRARRKYVAAQEGQCDRCPPHAKENGRKGRKALPDRHKGKDRRTIRTEGA